MANISNFIAIAAVQQNTAYFKKQLNVYGNIGFVVDEASDIAEGFQLPDEWFKARGVHREDLTEVVAMKLPADPFMHVWLYNWRNLSTKSQWPPVFNQVGSRGMTLLFDDVDKELSRLTDEFPETVVLQKPLQIERNWGTTTSALVLDPEGHFVELTSIANSKLAELAKPPKPHDRSFLHFMMNCLKFGETTKWYQSFGMKHDVGVDFRPEVGFNLGYDYAMNQMKTFSHTSGNMWKRCDFLRGDRDPSHMHLELLEYESSGSNLKDPGLDPTWFQKGISRYCMKTSNFEDALRDVKNRGYKIYIEEQRGCLNWGDSQWFFFGDADANILTLEQWFPHRYWGERT